MKNFTDSIIKANQQAQQVPKSFWGSQLPVASCTPGEVNYRCIMELDALYAATPQLIHPVIHNLSTLSDPEVREYFRSWAVVGASTAQHHPDLVFSWGDSDELSDNGKIARIGWLEGFLQYRIDHA